MTTGPTTSDETTDPFPAGGLPGVPPMTGLKPQEDHTDGPGSTRLYGARTW